MALQQSEPIKEKYPLEIMNIGMFRGGTSSLSKALTQLGCGPTWHLITNSQSLNDKGFKWWYDNDIVNKVLNSEYIDFDEWLQIIQCKTLMDTPIVFCWQKIFNQYPNCKVILCVRDFASWSKSYINLLIQSTDVTMKLCMRTDKYTQMWSKLWYKTHVGTDHIGMEQLLSLQESKRNKILKMEYYDKQIENAKRIVPKKQLLIFNPKDGWEPLCRFLNKPIPNKPFPRTNSTKQFNKWVFQWKMNAFRSQIKTKVCNIYILLVLVVFVISYLVTFFNLNQF